MSVWDRVGPRQSPVKNPEGEGSGFYEWIIKGNQRKCLLFESDRYVGSPRTKISAH